jgi:hypothetical protein
MSRKKTTTANTPSVRNCRARYALAPSWTASAIFFMLSVPSPAASTWRTRIPATTSAARATAAMTATMILLSSVRTAAARGVR